MKSFIMHSASTLVLSIFILSAHNVAGFPRQKNRMSNAHSDTSNMFKHEVRLTSQTGFSCSGSIVSNMHILTAAHCVVQSGTNDLTDELTEVTVGITQVDNQYELQTVRLAETIYVPKYYANPPPNSDEYLKNTTGDIALIKLNFGLGIGFDPRIESLKIPVFDYEAIGTTGSSKLAFTGFGGTKAVYNPDMNDMVAGEFPIYLQYSLAEALPSDLCPFLGNGQLKMCVKLANPGAGICGGDSGGALFNEDKIIFGVASYAAKTCDQSSPAVYTRVFPYLGFIVNAASDVLDVNTMQRKSYKDDPLYQKLLKENAYRYHWIYVPDLLKYGQLTTNS